MGPTAPSYAQVPGAGFWGSNQLAAVPPPMPGSPAAMAQAGANQYNSPIGPQQYGNGGFLRPYRSHDLNTEEPFNLAGRVASDALGAIPTVLAGAANYAGAKTPYGTTGTTAELGLNSQMGALKSLAGFAGNIPGLGAFAEKQFAGLEEAVYGPEQRARGRLSPTFEKMAMAGINVSDKEIEDAFKFSLPMERRGIAQAQRVARIGSMLNAVDALSSALGSLGR